VTQPGIPNEYSLSSSCFGSRLRTIEDQAFATVAMGFRRMELGLADSPVPLNGFEDSRRETGIAVRSLICGCLDPRSETMSGTRLGSSEADQRERALISVRRHVRLAQQYGCPVVVLRGCAVEDDALKREGDQLHARLVNGGPSDIMGEEIRAFVGRVQKKGQKQIEHLCRSIHSLRRDFPETRIALEPGMHYNDLLSFEAMGWVLEDLASRGLGYWHDTGRVHLRERAGLPPQVAWLDAYADRMMGVHLQDSAEGLCEMPPGTGEVDFRQVASYMSKDVERVIEINPRHGRTEILGAVHFLAGVGF
jgi:sugar phosphate isomerase/epimerase